MKEHRNDLKEPYIHYLNKWEEIILYGVNGVAMSTTNMSHCYGVPIKVNHLVLKTLNSKVLIEHIIENCRKLQKQINNTPSLSLG
jgi:hypothetical protein